MFKIRKIFLFIAPIFVLFFFISFLTVSSVSASQYDLHDKKSTVLTNHNGTSQVTTALPFTQSHYAVDFVGSSTQYLDVPANTTAWQQTGNYTVEMWFKTTSDEQYLAQEGGFIDKSAGWFIYMTGGKPRFYAGRNTGTTPGTDFQYVDTTSSLNDGNWHHLAYTYDGSNLKSYVDGSLDKTVSWSNNTVYPTSSYGVIGGRINSGTIDVSYTGKIDDFRIWSVAKSGTQINDDKAVELTGTESGLAAYYPFESLLQGVTYYTINDGTNFSRSTSPVSSGVATQTNNSDGSVTVSINSTSGYADSGFVLYEGTLGDLPNFTVNGTGNQYSLNLWLDTSSDNDYFAWDSNGVFTGLNSDTYALGPASSTGTDAISGSSQFYLMSDSQNHTFSDLKNGSVSGISSSTKVAVWVGVNTTSGSTSATITSIDGL